MPYRSCLVVPVYNHGAGAKALIHRIAPLGLQAILVNDASDDACRAVLIELSRSHSWVHLIEHRKNLGKGDAVLSGFREAMQRGFSHALQIDADGQHDSDDIPDFLAISQRNPESMVVGRPVFDISAPKSRRLARHITHVCVWIETLSFDIKDSMCGFRVYPLKAVAPILRDIDLGLRMAFDSEILVRLHWHGLPFISRRTRVVYPNDGHSHFRLWRDNWLISCMHARLMVGMMLRAPSLLLRRARNRRSADRNADSHAGTHGCR